MINQEEIEKVLISIGLSKNEVIIYLDLIRAGKSSALDISRRTETHRPSVYDGVEKLMERGLVTQTIEENRKVFLPVKPQALLNYVKQKEYELEKIVPEIEKIHNTPKEGRSITILKGLNSVKNIFLDMLESKETIYRYGIPEEGYELLGGSVIDFHKKRIKKKIPMKAIYNKDATKIIRELNEMDYTDVRYLPSLYDSSTSTCIYEDKIILIFWETPILALIIKDKPTAETYKKYFDIIWEETKISF